MTWAINPYIERIKKHAALHGKESAIERGTKMVCSWIIGREHGESVDVFFNRKPQYSEFNAWFETWKEQATKADVGHVVGQGGKCWCGENHQDYISANRADIPWPSGGIESFPEGDER